MKKKVVILGAGVGGLSAGWMLARTGHYDVTVVERAPVVGGACGTFEHNGFLLDYGPHKCYSVLPGVLTELRELMGDELIEHEKRNSIYLFGSLLDYPVRMTDLALKMGVKNLVQCGVGAAGTLFNGKKNDHQQDSYETYVISRFGRRLYELVFEPLAEKVWGEPATLSADIAATRIPNTSVVDVALKAVGLKKESEMTDAKFFYYPKRGFGRIPERMKEEIVKAGGRVLTGVSPTRITSKDFGVQDVHIGSNGTSGLLPCDLLISSIPLDILANLMKHDDDHEVNGMLENAQRLQYRTTFLVYIFLNQDRVTDQHWIFFPERDLIFSRVFEQKRMSEEMCPSGRTVLGCDFTDEVGGTLSRLSDEELAERCVSDLAKLEMIKREWVTGMHVRRLPKFYPRYDLHYKETVGRLYQSAKRYKNLLTTGRIGFYNYNNSDHCVDMGRFIADNLEAGKTTNEIWTEMETRVADYRIVD
ncbi:MAG: FAD-dependent oxidoreductase [bacterium]